MNLLSSLKPPSAEIERVKLKRSLARIERRRLALAAENRAERERIGEVSRRIEALEEGRIE